MYLSRLGHEAALPSRSVGLRWWELLPAGFGPLPSRAAGVTAKICGYCSGMRVKRTCAGEKAKVL